MARLVLLLGILLLTVRNAPGRPEIPRQYVPPSGTVSLARTMPFFQAIRALSELSGRMEHRVIIDDRERPFPIDVEIADMSWRDALDLIVMVHGLRYEEYADYIRIVDPGAQAQAQTPAVMKARYSADRREVHISAIFFEGDRRELRDRGINWGAVVKRGAYLHGLEHPVPGQVGVSVLKQQQTAAAGTAEDQGDAEPLREGVTAMIRALESESVGRVLANPSIQVVEGEEGRVQVGQDFSIKQIDFAGNVTDNFVSTGIILRVKPLVMVEDSLAFVHLEVVAERSSVSPGAVSTIVNKTQASTSLMLLDGERAAIAGLYTIGETNDRAGIPGLKDLPWWFFGIRYVAGTTRTEQSEKELVIILQASLVSELATRRVDDAHNEDYIEEERRHMKQRLRKEAEPPPQPGG